MENKMFNPEVIESYLDGSMPSSDRVVFEKEMTTNEALKSEVESQKLAAKAAYIYGAKMLKTSLQKMDAEMTTKTNSWSMFLSAEGFKRLSMAAAVLAITGLMMVGGVFKNSNNSSDLFTEYYKPYPNVIAPVVRSNSEMSQTEYAMSLYEQSEFEKAIIEFNTLLSENSENADVLNFYKGLSHLSLGNTEKAIQSLELVGHKCQLSEQTDWYLALAYLTKEDYESSILKLNEVIDYGDFYSERADELRKQLK